MEALYLKWWKRNYFHWNVFTSKHHQSIPNDFLIEGQVHQLLRREFGYNPWLTIISFIDTINNPDVWQVESVEGDQIKRQFSENAPFSPQKTGPTIRDRMNDTYRWTCIDANSAHGKWRLFIQTPSRVTNKLRCFPLMVDYLQIVCIEFTSGSS